jgi:fumarylacetoacetate (FAA) hydrolase
MILATLVGGGPDGTLVVVSRDRRRLVLSHGGPRTMQEALDRWDESAPELERTFVALDDEDLGSPVADHRLHSPLPRAYHWAEGSCYLPHMERIRGSRMEALPAHHEMQPKVYQSGGDQHPPPVSDWPLPDPDLELDIEGTIVVFTGPVPLGSEAGAATDAVRLVGLTNDLTYRRLIVEERQEGSGIYHSKPNRAYAPFAVTPDTLGEIWDGARLRAQVRTTINREVIGEPWADRDLAFDFGRILEHLSRTRPLMPGSIVGTGTVSNSDPTVGLGCIAEKRAIEKERDGEPSTRFLEAGDRVEIEAFDPGGESIFGRIVQSVVAGSSR